MPVTKVFVDTNLWVYAHLQAPGDARHALALDCLESRPDKVISPQVVAEYYSVMLPDCGGCDGGQLQNSAERTCSTVKS